MSKSRLPIILIAGGGVLALVVLAMILMSRSGGSEPLAEETTVVTIEPTPTPVAPEATTQPRAGSRRAGAVFGTSVRDPFKPQATPSSSSDPESKTSDKSKSSNPTSSSSRKTKSTLPKASGSKKPVAGSGSADSKSSKSDSAKNSDSGSKAPQPIGGPSTDGEEPTAQVEVVVLDVKEAMTVVRINGSRSTLYLNVPDPSGVTFMSALDARCAWFSRGDVNERLTICEGDSRQM